MPSRSSRPSAAIAKHAYHSLPGLPSIGWAMSAETCLSVGEPSIQRGSMAPSGSFMANLLEVGDVGAGAEILEDAIRTLAAHVLRDLAVRIVEIAEYDRVGRADLLTRGLDLAVLDRLARPVRGVLGGGDPLDAQTALLHHAARAHRDVRVEHQAAHRIGHVVVEPRVLGVVVPVEPPDLVWAVVGAIPRSDAAIVDLLIEALGAGRRREHRTHGLARRVAAVLAHHRLVDDVRVVLGAAVVTVDADPVHDALALDLVLADHGHVVLGLTRDDARRAARAGVDVDRHAPRLLAHQALVPQVGQLLGLLAALGELGAGGLEHARPDLHREVALGLGELGAPPGVGDRGVVPHPARAAHHRGVREQIRTGAVAGLADLAVAPADGDRQRAQMLAGLDQRGQLDRAGLG